MKRENVNIIYERVRALEKNFYWVTLYPMPVSEFKVLHYHEAFELGVCLSGSGKCMTDSDEMPFSAGDVQLILPFQPHYNITDREGAVWIFITVDLLKMSSPHLNIDVAYFAEIARKIDISGVFTKEGNPEIHRLITDIARIFQGEARENIALSDILTLKFTELLILLSHNKAHSVDSYGGQKKDRSVLPAMNYVSTSLDNGRRPTVAGMAEACFMSESYFRKLFKASTGESPKSYILRIQTGAAATMLATTNLSTSEIYTRCGFEDYSTFYRSFLQVYQASPAEYRKKCRQD